MKKMLCLALACLAAGCSSIQTAQTLPDYSGIKDLPEAGRAAYYERMKVAEVRDDDGRIGDLWYSRSQLKQIYKETGSRDARHWANGSLGRKIAMTVAPPVTLGACAVFGLYFGAVAYDANAKYVYTYDGTNYVRKISYDGDDESVIYKGALIGTGIGLMAAAIEYGLLRSSATNALRKSGDAFNHKLLQDLHLDLEPQPGGAKAGVSGKF